MSGAEANKIGVLIPTYNRQSYLKEALKSALDQTWDSLEIIVIDNGSTDGTVEMMTGVTDARVRYVVNPHNLGLLGSINRGVRLFSESVQWMTILPDDDLLDANFIRSMVIRQQEVVARSVMQGRTIIVDGGGAFVREANTAPEAESALDYLLGRAKRRRESYLTGVYFSRAAFELIGGYPQFATGMATDDAFIFALAFSDRLYAVPEATVCVRNHQEAESQQVTGVLEHINALQDFKCYVMTRVKSVEMLSPSRQAEIADSIDGYVRSLGSGLWIRNVKTLFRLRPADLKSQLAILVNRVIAGNWADFSWRVRVAAVLTALTGFCPEQYVAYRALWEILECINAGRQ